MNDIWVPIILFVSISTLGSLALWFRHRTRAQVQQTLRSAIDKGQELSPELLERLGEGIEPQRRDLRRGIISVALSLGFVSFGFILNETDAIRPLLGIAAFPFLIGVAYLFLARLETRRS